MILPLTCQYLAEIYEALVEAGASVDSATAAAGVVAVKNNLATKTDLQELRSEMKSELKVLKFTVFSIYPFILASNLQDFFLTQ